MTEYELAALIYQVVDVATGSLKWRGFTLADTDSMAKFIPGRVAVLGYLTYFGTPWFFFHMRRRCSIGEAPQ